MVEVGLGSGIGMFCLGAGSLNFRGFGKKMMPGAFVFVWTVATRVYLIIS